MIIKGIAAWARVHNPKEAFSGEVKKGPRKGQKFTIQEQYCIDLFLDDKTIEEYKQKGVRFKLEKPHKEVPGIEDSLNKKYVRIQSFAKYPDGAPAPKPAVFGEDGQSTTALIGNGSEVTVQAAPREVPKDIYSEDGTMTKIIITHLTLQAVKVDKLVEHTSKKSPSSQPGSLKLEFSGMEGTEIKLEKPSKEDADLNFDKPASEDAPWE
jgi:hypothetical protein